MRDETKGKLLREALERLVPGVIRLVDRPFASDGQASGAMDFGINWKPA